MKSKFIVERILNAQLYTNRQQQTYWVFHVKWFDNGHYTSTMENEFHPVFQKNPSILKRFWDSLGIDPETYTTASVIPATDAYTKECKQDFEGLTYLSKRQREESPSPRRSEQKRPHTVNGDEPTVIIMKNGPGTPMEEEEYHAQSNDEESDDTDAEAKAKADAKSKAKSLPPIATLEDLPDFDDSDIVESISQVAALGLEPNVKGTAEPLTPSTFSSLDVDVLMADLDTVPKPEPMDPEIITISSSPDPDPMHSLDPVADSEHHVIDPEVATDPDADLYVDHSFVVHPSTFVPISSVIVSPPQSTETQQSPKSSFSYSPSPALQTTTTSSAHVQSEPRLNVNSQPPQSISPPPAKKERIQKTPPAFTSPVRPVLRIETLEMPLNVQTSKKRDYPGFTLRIEDNSKLPLNIRDDRSHIFNDFFTVSNNPLAVHGYYRHDDITKLFQSCQPKASRGFARIYLDANSPLKDIWKSLCDDMASKNLCLVMFAPDAKEAFLLFSSLSKPFGRSINAPVWAMGIRDRGLVIARVSLKVSDLCFEKQYR